MTKSTWIPPQLPSCTEVERKGAAILLAPSSVDTTDLTLRILHVCAFGACTHQSPPWERSRSCRAPLTRSDTFDGFSRNSYKKLTTLQSSPIASLKNPFLSEISASTAVYSIDKSMKSNSNLVKRKWHGSFHNKCSSKWTKSPVGRS